MHEDILRTPNEIREKIKIIQASIVTYQKSIDFFEKSDEDSNMLSSLKNEEKLLETMKSLYPEYFI